MVHVRELDRLADTPKRGAANFARESCVAIDARTGFDFQTKRVFVRASMTFKKQAIPELGGIAQRRAPSTGRIPARRVPMPFVPRKDQARR